MDPIPRPVISCYGHEGLVSEFEQRCSQTMVSEPALWRHSKHVQPYPVRIDAYFTRFNLKQPQSTVKVLSSGRPTRSLGAMDPILYVYVVSNNTTQYSSGGVKQKLASWLGQLQAGNINDWVVIMIDADQQTNKMWQKTNVLDQIKRDFRVPASSSHLLQIPDRRSVEEKVFVEAWTTFVRSLRKLILSIYQSTIQDYEDHLQLLQEARETAGWEFFEYLERKEELAQLYLAVNGFEDALQQYYSLESLFSFALRSAAQLELDKLPTWVTKLTAHTPEKDELCSFLSYYPWVKSRMHSHLLELIRTRSASVFDLRNYLLSRECGLLKAYSRLHELPSRALLHIRQGLEESKLLKLCTFSETEHIWAFLCALNCIDVLYPSKNDALEEITQSLTAVLSNAFQLTLREPKCFTPSYYAIEESELNDVTHKDHIGDHNLSQSHPALTSLATAIHHVYKFIRTYRPLPSNKTQQHPESAISQAVDLWLMAFIQLTHLGRVLSLWKAEEEVSSPSAFIQMIKVSVFQCFASDLTDKSSFGRSLHKQLGLLLTSASLYQECYITMAQTLIGLLQLIGEHRRCPYVCYLLADFLRSKRILPKAVELYTIALSVYLRDGWSNLAIHACLLLVCCLRSFLNEQGDQETSLDHMIRYFECCLFLSCAPIVQLELATRTLEPTTFAPSGQIQVDLSDSPFQLGNLVSTEFWWSEVVKHVRGLPDDLMLDASLSLTVPFHVEFIDLDGASEDGFQLITVGLRLTSAVPFSVRVQADGSKPDVKEWETIMQYGISSKQWQTQTSLAPSETDLQFSDLNANLINIVKSEGGSPVLKPKTIQSRSLAHIFRRDTNALYHSTESVGQLRSASKVEAPQNEPRRKKSFLDTAASLATRSAWGSQDGLHVVRLSRTSSIGSVGPEIARQNTDDSTAKSHGVTQSGMFQVGQSHGGTGSAASNSSEIHVEESPCADGELDMGYLRVLDSNTESTFDVSFETPEGKEGNDVLLKPGLNRIQLKAKHRGFFIPKRVVLSIMGRGESSGSTVSLSDCSFQKALFKICYDLHRSELSVTWADKNLLDHLLPKLSLPTANGSRPTPVVLGLRQSIPVQLTPGKVGFPITGGENVVLYRLLPNSDQNSPVSPHSKPKLGPSDYTITPPVELKLETGSPQLLTFPYDYQDGPVSVVAVRDNEEEPDINKENQAPLKLVRPLSIAPITDNDEFVIVMPSGHLCQFPVRIIRPFAMMLNIYTIRPSDTVIFAIRIACVDVAQPQNPNKLNFVPVKPLTYRVSKFHFGVTAPTPQDSELSSSRKQSSTGTPMFSFPPSLASSRRGSSLQMAATKSQQTNLADCMFADPVNPECTEIEVNHLCPVSLLFQVKFSEFRPFMKSLMERYAQSPIARFTCSFGFSDDPDYEAELTFRRAISPVRQNMAEKIPVSVKNSLIRTRREQRIAS